MVAIAPTYCSARYFEKKMDGTATLTETEASHGSEHSSPTKQEDKPAEEVSFMDLSFCSYILF